MEETNVEELGKPTYYRLFKRQEAVLDEVADKAGVNRVVVLRWAIDSFLGIQRVLYDPDAGAIVQEAEILKLAPRSRQRAGRRSVQEAG